MASACVLVFAFIAFLQEIGFHFSTSPFQDLFHLYFEIFKEEFHADILVIDLKKLKEEISVIFFFET